MYRLALSALALAFGAAPTLALDPMPSGITTRQHGSGWTLIDDKGMTIYTFDRDEGAPGRSTCNEECPTTWPPMLAAEDAGNAPGWSKIKRNDGALQWAYKGRPIYRYALDAFPGAGFGDGVDSVWRIAIIPIPTPAEINMGPTVLGKVLTDAKGMTLYTADADTAGAKPSCTDKCLWSWTPVTAPLMAAAFDDWTAVQLDNGARQWAYKGKPLYRHVADVAAGEINGTKIKGWSATVLEPAPPRPPFTTVNASDAGELLGNEQGLTLYTRELNPRFRRFFNPNCEGECVDPQWRPVIAGADAKPIGNWLVIDTTDGRKQWSYKGMKVYTNIADKKPGDFRGVRFGGDRTFSAIMRSGQPMQGVTVGG